MYPRAARPGKTILLDGPIGSVLEAAGVPVPPPLWSAAAVARHPAAIAALHAAYADAGATVHTAATFRTTARAAGPAWRELAARAVALARGAVRPGHRVAGSVAPLEDCYRPDLSPDDPGPEHAATAGFLARQGVDLLLCETFPHVGEALAAVDACVATGLPTWVSFTPGPRGDLLGPEEVRDGAREAVRRGASAVLVNCLPPEAVTGYLDALSAAGAPVGAYANLWGSGLSPEAYAALAAAWGADVVGACCGAGPEHIRALAREVGA